jgi:hypothetical protein
MGSASAWRGALVVAAAALGLLVGCAAGRPTSLTRLPDGHEVLTAHCETAPPPCRRIHVTGNPADEEAWGFRARPVPNALWREPEIIYSVGDRARCDAARAALGTPTEACWGPVYFRRE